MSRNTFIIAEAGVNHNGDIQLAKQLVDAALETGADAVKFQTFKAELLVTEKAEMAEYQITNTNIRESQFQMLKKLELGYDNFRNLKQYCDDKGILFLSTAAEEKSATFLNDLQPIFKLGSGDLTNLPMLKHIASFNKPIILSSGMGTLGEIEDAIKAIVLAGLDREKITVLHATTEYPTLMQDVNLNAMLTIKNAFPGISVGYSDHTPGIEVSVAAVALGAEVIEKHFTLNKNMPGPDHKASLDPIEFSAMVKAIRNIELALGNGQKEPCEVEKRNLKIVRKSIVASKDIKKGEVFSVENIAIKRPGNGLPPSRWDEVINTTSLRDYAAGDLI